MSKTATRRAWLVEIRQGMNMSTYKVAASCGINQSYYSMIERGVRDPSVQTAKKIGAAMGFDWQRFYDAA